MCNEQLALFTETRESTECRAFQKKRLLGKKLKSSYLAPFKKQKKHRPIDQCLQKELENSKRLNFELEVIKVVDCSLDGHGNYDSNLVSSTIKPLYQTKFCATVSKGIQRIRNAS